MHWLNKDFNQALGLLQNLQIPQDQLRSDPYAPTLQLQACVLTSWTLHALEKSHEALQHLQTLHVASDHFPSTLTEYHRWAEEYYFQKALLSHSLDASPLAQESRQIYLDLTLNLSPNLFTSHRISVSRWYLELELEPLLSHRNGFLSPFLIQPFHARAAIITRRLQEYQSLLRSLVDLSKGGDRTQEETARSRQLLESLDWLFAAQSIATQENEPLQDAIDRHISLIEVSFVLQETLTTSHSIVRVNTSFCRSKSCASCLSPLSRSLDSWIQPSQSLITRSLLQTMLIDQEAQRLIELYQSLWMRAYHESCQHYQDIDEISQMTQEATGETLSDVLLVAITGLRLRVQTCQSAEDCVRICFFCRAHGYRKPL